MSVVHVPPSSSVKIGLCIVREGTHVSYGSGLYEGAYLACEELPPIGNHHVQLVVQDEVSDYRENWRVVADFIREDVVGIVGPMTFGAARVLIPLLATAGICSLIPCINNPDVTRWGLPSVFRVDLDAGAQAEVQAAFVTTSLRKKRVLILHDTSVFWTGVARVFELGLKATTSRRVPFALGISSLNTLALEAARWQPDLVYAASSRSELISLLQALRGASIDAPVLACAALQPPDLQSLSGRSIADVYLTKCVSPTANYEPFGSRFKALFGHDPGYYSAEAYDAVTAIIRAVHTVPRDNRGTLEIDRQALMRAVSRDKFLGVTGQVEFDDKGDRLDQGMIIVEPVLDSGSEAMHRVMDAKKLNDVAPPNKEAETGIELFYSYCHVDESLRKELEKHLSILRRQHVITEWHYRKITAGKEWKREIDEHLNSAKVILLLVSADFVDSDYCYDSEMQKALERHQAGDARVIPVILRDCDWNYPPLGDLQALPTGALAVTSWPNRDEAFSDVAKGIREAIQQMIKRP